jgi:hypothetical protein
MQFLRVHDSRAKFGFQTQSHIKFLTLQLLEYK